MRPVSGWTITTTFRLSASAGSRGGEWRVSSTPSAGPTTSTAPATATASTSRRGARRGRARRVDDDPPDPRLERAGAAEAARISDRSGERLLHDVGADLAVARDRRGNAAELLESRAVEGFQPVDHLDVRRARGLDFFRRRA